MLRIAALLGVACEADLLAEVAGLELEPVDRALSAGELHGLLEVGREGPSRFTHALVRDHLYDGLSAGERRELHEVAAKVLIRRHGDSEAHAETVLHHLLRAGGAEPGDVTTTWRVHAARAAARRFAWEEAARHYDAALVALERQHAPEAERAALWIALGTAQARRGAAAEALAAFARARELARELGSGRLLALAALGAKGDARSGAADQTSDPERVAILEEALGVLEGEPVLRARLLAGLATELYWAGDRERVESLAAEALSVARGLSAARERCELLIEVLTASWWPDNLDERLALANEATTIAESIEHPAAIVAAAHLRSVAHIERGDPEAADADLARAQDGAERWGFPLLRHYSRNVSVVQHLARGDYDEAEALSKEQLADGGRLGAPHMGAMHAAHMLQLLLSRGQAALALGPLRGMAEQTGLALTRASLAYVLCLEGEDDEARSALRAMLDDGLDALPRDFFWLGALVYLAEAAAHLGERAAAAAIREELRPFSGRAIVVGFGTNHLGAVDRVLGRLAHALGESGEAAECLERAVALERRCGNRPHLALALEARAALLDTEEGKAPLATSLRAEAAAIRDAIGLRLVAPEVTVAAGADESPDADALLENRGAAGWRVRFEGREVPLPDARGLVYLAELLIRPGEEVHVLDLLARVAPESADAPSAGGGDDLMDARARREVSERMESLRSELADAEARADLGRADRARAELEALEDSLAAAFGLGGRARRAGDATERARKAVYNRIRAVTRRLEETHPELAVHLRNSVQTGRTCVYRPERPVAWGVRAGAG